MSEDGMFSFSDSERKEIEDEFDTDFTTGKDVDQPGNANIDVAQSQDELDELFDAMEDQGDAVEEESSPTPETEENTPEDSDADNDGDFLEYARHCKCGASFRSKSAFDEHVDKVENGTGICSTVTTAYATDGGATTQPVTPPTPSLESDEKPTVPSLTTAEQMLKLEEDEQERFGFLMQFCMKSYQGERPRRRVLFRIVNGDGPGYDDLAEAVGKGTRVVKKYVKELRDAGIVVTQGQGSPTTNVVFDKWTMEALAAHALSRTEYVLDE